MYQEFGPENYEEDDLPDSLVYRGVVQEILHNDENALAIKYIAEGSNLPFIILRSPLHPEFQELRSTLKAGSNIQIRLDDDSEIFSVEVISSLLE